MPKKVVVKIKKQKQKQKQSQNVKQTVIIRLDKEGKKIKRRRKRPRQQGSDGVSSMQRELPPPVIYQGVSVPAPYPVFREAPKVRTINEEPVPKGFLEDIGQVGTEGAVQILEPPEPEYVNLVQKPKPMTPPEQVRTRRNKKEMTEAMSMEREDIAAISLGLSQFEPSFKKPQISKGLPERGQELVKKEFPAGIGIPESFTPLFEESRIEKPLSKTGKPIESLMTEESLMEEQNIPESVLKGKRVNKGSWNYWLQKFQELTGQKITEYQAKRQFGTKETFAEYITSNLK